MNFEDGILMSTTAIKILVENLDEKLLTENLAQNMSDVLDEIMISEDMPINYGPLIDLIKKDCKDRGEDINKTEYLAVAILLLLRIYTPEMIKFIPVGFNNQLFQIFLTNAHQKYGQRILRDAKAQLNPKSIYAWEAPSTNLNESPVLGKLYSTVIDRMDGEKFELVFSITDYAHLQYKMIQHFMRIITLEDSPADQKGAELLVDSIEKSLTIFKSFLNDINTIPNLK